jgi:spermidine synthase
VLLPFLSPCRIFHLLAISVLVSSIVYFYFSHENRSRWRIAAFLIVPVLLLPAGRWQVLTETLRLRSQYGLFEHVETRQTPYQRLDLLERAGQYSLFGNGHFIGSFPDPYVWREKVHTALLQHASPESVLIAGGDPQMIPFVLAHGVEKVDWVEMDPELIDLRLEYGSREEQRWMQDKRVRLIREDARRFIRHTGNQASSHYDIILLNVADPSTAQLNRYYTGEFYREAVRALNERGVLVTSVQASVIATGTEVVDFARVIYGSLVRVFSHIALQPGQEIHFYACRAGGQVSEEAEVLARRYRQRNIEPEALAYAFEASFQPVQISDLRAELDSQPEPPRNTDLHPAAYLYQIALWNRWAGSRLSGLLQSTRRISPLVLPVAVILLMLAGNLTGWRKSHQAQTRFHLSIAIAVLGLSGMSLELLLMFAYQNALGVVYERVAFVVALFMLGLITGGTTSHRLVHRPGMGKRRKMNLLRILLALTALTAALLPLGVMASVRYELAAPVILLSLVAWAGVLTGFGFPLAVSLYQRPGEPVARAAGVLDASDHAGAMCGAVLTATVWLPLWGVTTTALLLAGVNMMLVLWMRGELK